MLGILPAEENRSGSRGNYYSYELDVPFESAIEAMEDALRLDAETNAIREIALMNGLETYREFTILFGVTATQLSERPDWMSIMIAS